MGAVLCKVAFCSGARFPQARAQASSCGVSVDSLIRRSRAPARQATEKYDFRELILTSNHRNLMGFPFALLFLLVVMADDGVVRCFAEYRLSFFLYKL